MYVCMYDKSLSSISFFCYHGQSSCFPLERSFHCIVTKVMIGKFWCFLLFVCRKALS